MPRILILTFAGVYLLAACAEFPDLDRAITQGGRNAPYPRLIQIDGALGPESRDFERVEMISKSLSARAQNLRRRAQALRGPIIDGRTRRQMARALARHPIANGG